MKDYIRNVSISPITALAGDSVEITIRLEVGRDFITQGSGLVYDLPATLGFSRPSCYDQEDDGYAAVFVSNPDVYYEKKVFDMEYQRFGNKVNASFKGMAQRLFAILFHEGELSEGDEVVFKWGFTRNGFGTGTKVTTIVPYPDYDNIVHVRYFEDSDLALPDLGRDIKGQKRPVPDAEVPLSFRVIPREPEKIRIIKQAEKTSVLILDRFANICPISDIHEFLEGNLRGHFNGHGVYELDDRHAVITSKGLPMTDTPSMQKVYGEKNIYFGDLHTHSATSNDTIEREKMIMTPDLSYDYAKESACLDFLAVTDHHQPWDEERNKIGEPRWGELSQAVEKHDKPGSFLAFEGFEFRCQRGDTTVIIKDHFDYSEIDDPSLTDIRKVWEKFQGRDYLTTFHFHNPGSLKEDEWFKCPYEGIEPVIEIYSCHGSYEMDKVLERNTPEIKFRRKDRNGTYFLNNGNIYGLTCNSDGHKGNPGSNGLTAVYAESLDKESIFEAIRKRQVYGTTNARIRLLFTANSELMGAVLPASETQREFYFSIKGEDKLKSVDIIRNGELYHRYRPDTIAFEEMLTIQDEEKAYYYVRATQFDNHIAYSSPIWFL